MVSAVLRGADQLCRQDPAAVLSLRAYRRPHVAVLQMVQEAVGEDGAGHRVGGPPLAAGATLFMELEFSGPASGEDIVATGSWADPSAFG